jgi:hypothetical protein
MRMGLGYMIFKGKSELLKEIKENPSLIAASIKDKRSIFSERNSKKDKPIEIVL